MRVIGDNSQMFKVTDNGTFRFKITGSNGRSTRVACDVTNVLLTKVDILTAVAEMTNGGKKKVKVVSNFTIVEENLRKKKPRQS